jgi:broad specificity phosphatase PhoE
MVADPTQTTIVHLVRHGEVHNPTGVIYGRLPGYHLSERGMAMAERLGEFFSGRGAHGDDAEGLGGDIAAVVASPLWRAQQTAAPIGSALGLSVDTDDRLIEAENIFEGRKFAVGDGVLRRPSVWPRLVNPFRPSWGEPYQQQVDRMTAAMNDARGRVPGRAVVCVSHQLPIWVTRMALENRRLWHDPRKRQCTLASVTTITYLGDTVVSIVYREPAGDLLPVKQAVAAGA